MHISTVWRRMKKMMNVCLAGCIMLAPATGGGGRIMASAKASAALRPQHGKVVMAYVFDAKAPKLLDRDAPYLTHINWSFGLIKNGRVSGDHWKNIDKLVAYKKKHPQVKTVLSIGGWEADGFSQAASSADGIALFVSSTMELVKQYGFDGVDIDWEYPCSSAAGIAASPDDKQNFTKLLRGLRNGLDALEKQDGKQKILTIACGASVACAKSIECANIAPLLDYVNIMTYDLHGAGQSKQTRHHTNLYPMTGEPGGDSAHTALLAFEKQGIPRSKLVMGAGFYGHMWKNVTADAEHPDGLGQPAGDGGGSTVSFANLVSKYIGQNGYTRYWDDEAKAPYLFNGSSFITYDDEESLMYKAAYVRERGLAGMMFWEYTQDSSSRLLKAIVKGLNGK